METIDDHQLDWLDEVLPGGPVRILDAGCGDGGLAAALARHGHEVTALDISAEAVAAARSAGVPAVRADLASHRDDPFDVIILSLSLHHMSPLEAVLDRAAALLAPGGTLAVDEFAWDRAGAAGAAWFYDAGALLAAAGLADCPRGPCPDPAARWRAAHAGYARGDAMLTEIAARFRIGDVRREPYLSRYLGGRLASGAGEVAGELWRIERERIAAGTLPCVGFRVTAGRK